MGKGAGKGSAGSAAVVEGVGLMPGIRRVNAGLGTCKQGAAEGVAGW